MTYRVPVREASLRAAIASIWRRRFRTVAALKSVDLSIEVGESVALIGPNGAGKTTLMKILAGILRPSAGVIEVLGQDPFQRRPAYLKKIALVRGSQPLSGAQELTVMDSLKYQRLVYDLDSRQFERNLDELVPLLGLDHVVDRQIRALSLGERMRAGLAAALIYRPSVLFFDEPTIGLDVSAALQTRAFLKKYVDVTGATLLLTSHYMADVAELCSRVVLVNEGSKVFDGPLGDLTRQFDAEKVIEVWLTDGEGLPAEFSATYVDGHYDIRVARDEVANVAARLFAASRILDLSVRETPLDVVIHRVYQGRLGGN